MSQRLLEANQRNVAAAGHVVERIRLLQDRAVLLARLGRVTEAERTLSDAETQMPADAPRLLKLRFAYVRAIDTYFSKRFADAQQKMYAALREARSSNEPSLVAECESALALFMQREGDVRAAMTHARSVLANSDATLEARYRWNRTAYDYLEPVVRYYQQSAADFYRTYLVQGEPIPQFASADYRLADMDAVTVGAKYGRRLASGREFSVRLEYYRQTADPQGTPFGALRSVELVPTTTAIIAQFGYKFDW